MNQPFSLKISTTRKNKPNSGLRPKP
jgi:hypothetical protein